MVTLILGILFAPFFLIDCDPNARILFRIMGLFLAYIIFGILEWVIRKVFPLSMLVVVLLFFGFMSFMSINFIYSSLP